ncbi:ATP-binding cassette domain-containing protein [Phytoactinopolyspora endophytica]|uniref:ATP-binding cassette domain-containing protein n=1 Tax=Phytoactinopolyspora endophytica TaxID=1642495 RepID=UPI00101C7387|nr:ATP-binding cassette domain-containing protein [Phytoactinopolyspora endophytica]
MTDTDVRHDPAAVALHVHNVSKRYGRLRALDDVSLSVHGGEIVGVIGENGAGKSTLVGCIAGDTEPDEGHVDVSPSGSAVAVVWQDLGLCEDLDVVANVFLGRERSRVLLAETQMGEHARQVFNRFGSQLSDLRARVDTLSRGERQEVALARALTTDAEILVLDEPTASLSVIQRTGVVRLLREIRADGRAILLISHDLDELFSLADRILVLRHGKIVADVSPLEVHADDVTALMSGIETESMARRQLNRLKSLVEQLSAANPGASLPIVMSATAAALDQDMLCIHLLEPRPDGTVLRRTAAVGLPLELLTVTEELAVGTAGGPVGAAAQFGELVTADDGRDDPAWSGYLETAAASGVRSTWSAPIVGGDGVLGAITGFSAAAGRLDQDHAELVSLYAGHAATAIERERLLDEVSRRNDVLESLRAMLETLAGPDRVDGGLSAALFALCRGLNARAVGILLPDPGPLQGSGPRWVAVDLDGKDVHDVRQVAEAVPATVGRPVPLENGVAIAGLPLPEGRGVLVSRWLDPAEPGRDALELLDDARRSLALALEREGVELARHEAAAARRSQALQRDLLQQISHELRTPLTAIHGYASTLQQPDLTWDAGSVDRFLTAISTESARMERLVGDLLDSSAIESGLLRLRRDWTDLRPVLASARDCVSRRESIQLRIDPGLEPIWADHDRLEQVFVNLMENAVRHGPADGTVEVAARPAPVSSTIEILVSDDGAGVPLELAEDIFEPRVRGDGGRGAGLGLAIARGIAEAHGGKCELVPGRTTTFRVALPVEPLKEEDAHAAQGTVDGPGWQAGG